MKTGRLLKSTELPRFRTIIDDYHPDPMVLSIFAKSDFSIIAGPSGAGKDSLRNNLIKLYPSEYAPVLSSTTRPMREGETDSIDYHFLSPEIMETKLLKGEFFQVALVHNQQISSLHINEITKLRDGQIGLSILIVQTETELAAIKRDIRTIFIIPPSLEELRNRLGGDQQLSDDEVERRMKASKSEMITALERRDYYCLVNDKLDRVTELTHEFLQKGHRDNYSDIHARNTIQSILNKLSI